MSFRYSNVVCILDLTASERLAEEARADVHTLDDEDYGKDNFADILDGTARAEISHGGEDFQTAAGIDEDELVSDLRASHRCVCLAKRRAVAHPFLLSRLFAKRHDFRKRRNRTELLLDGFKPHMEGIADAYVDWDFRTSSEGLGTLLDPPADSMVEAYLPMVVVDLFSKSRCTCWKILEG